MKNILRLLVLFLLSANLFAQRETYDLTSFIAPKGWKKEVKENSYTSFTGTNQQTKSYCQIFIMLSTTSKGSIKKDFENEWQTLIANQYGVTDAPQLTDPVTEAGWQIKSGMASFAFNNGTSTAMLTTMTGYNKAVSIVTVTNSPDYIPAIQQFLESVEMKTVTNQSDDNQHRYSQSTSTLGNGGFAFTTTTFDDGWSSTVKDDWVQVTRGTTIILIHYPNKQADVYNSVLMDGLKNAWNVLVAPKYSSASNFEFKPLTNWEPIEFAEADMVEKSSGRQVHVVLFKKNYYSGVGKYVEFITTDKKSFEQEFGAYHEGSSGWEKMENMASYNKFAVAASDLSGKWTNDYSGAIQYVNANTGFDAGMDTHASKENFYFGPGNNYQWDLGVASGAVGNIKFQSVKSSGDFSMVSNWQVKLSDIEGKPRTYNVFFSCIKGARILWIDGKAFGRIE